MWASPRARRAVSASPSGESARGRRRVRARSGRGRRRRGTTSGSSSGTSRRACCSISRSPAGRPSLPRFLAAGPSDSVLANFLRRHLFRPTAPITQRANNTGVGEWRPPLRERLSDLLSAGVAWLPWMALGAWEPRYNIEHCSMALRGQTPVGGEARRPLDGLRTLLAWAGTCFTVGERGSLLDRRLHRWILRLLTGVLRLPDSP